MASLPRLAHRPWGAGDAWNALLTHWPCCAHLAITGRSLRTWGTRKTIFSCDANTNISLFTFGAR